MQKQFLEAGKIVGIHGIKGELKIQSWCDNLTVLTTLNTLYIQQGAQSLSVRQSRVHKNIVVLKVEGVDQVEQAQSMIGQIVYLDRKDLSLEEGCYFIQDLIGCNVIDQDDEKINYGVLIDVSKTGANDVYHIKQPTGQVAFIPAIPQVLCEIIPEQRKIIITTRQLEGLFDAN